MVAVNPRPKLEIHDHRATENDDSFGDFATIAIAIAPAARGSRWHHDLHEILSASRTHRDSDVFVTNVTGRGFLLWVSLVMNICDTHKT
ncbi:hypothetical protein TIFTF001_043260 [Ficus carica]|uniref:Uncharacterized protein n=1 Tax=Ficus carica TaxID=3494 RepID=A0AA87YSY3_FICCA|nr:hypothetical protein TIFTF001_043260 [Ficus carica]